MATLQIKKATFSDSLVIGYDMKKEYTELSFQAHLASEQKRLEAEKPIVISQKQVSDKYRLTNIHYILFNLAYSYGKQELDQLFEEGYIQMAKVNKSVTLISFIPLIGHDVSIDTTIELIISDDELNKDELLSNLETVFKQFKAVDKNRHFFISKKANEYLGILDNKSFLAFLQA